MSTEFTLEYWVDDGWFVGRLKEVPGVFSQGETLEELADNVRDAYQLVAEAEPTVVHRQVMTRKIEVGV